MQKSDEKELALSFLFMSIESQTFVISNILFRVESKNSIFLAFAFISEALEVIRCNSFECIKE